jgi:geranylgeranyl diphosphate synthase type I
MSEVEPLMSQGELSSFAGHWLPQIETEMRAVLANGEGAVAAHYGMMHYHLGWVNETFQPDYFPTGKRLRPLLCLLACAELGGDPTQALPAAAGIELLHNFSLIHDDIEDGDETRRGRPTLWKLWGEAQAINAGDGMFALAFGAMQRLARRGLPDPIVLAALDLFTQTCVSLTEGQHLDLSFEQRDNVTVDEYLRMIQGKTAVLIGASVAIGALISGAAQEQSEALNCFGRSVGLAFQIQDDILGIWGNPEETGKPAGNDILRKKKSLPLLYALNHAAIREELHGLFARSLSAADLPEVIALLDRIETRHFAEEQAHQYHLTAVEALHTAFGPRASRSALLALANSLLNRAA